MENNNQNKSSMNKGLRIGFGLFMVIVYVGMGYLFLKDFFGINNQYISTPVGIVLIIYGIWRGFRMYKGIN